MRSESSRREGDGGIARPKVPLALPCQSIGVSEAIMPRAPSLPLSNLSEAPKARSVAATRAFLELTTIFAISLMFVQGTVGLVAEPFFPDLRAWIYRAALVLLVPGVASVLLSPLGQMTALWASLGLLIAGARLLSNDGHESLFPVLGGIFTAVSSATIRRAPALRGLCWTFASLVVATFALLLAGDIDSGGFRERLGFAWGASMARSAREPEELGLVFNPNDVAFLLAIAMSIAPSLSPAGGRATVRASAAAVALIATVGLFATGSRGMAVAGLAGFALSLRSAKGLPIRSTMVVSIALVMAVCAATLLSYGSNLGPLVRNDLLSSLPTIGDRLEIWGSSLERQAESPFLGPGREVIGGSTRSPHNLLLFVGELAGVFGICILVLIIGTLVRHGRRSPHFGAPVLLCIFIAGMSMDILANPVLLAFVGLGCSPAALWMEHEHRVASKLPMVRHVRRAGNRRAR